MSEEEAVPKEVAAEEAAEEESGPSILPLLIYGITADVMLILPIILYLVLDNATGYSKFHHSYIQMLAITYGPFALSKGAIWFWDCEEVRWAIGAALMHAGMGAYSLLWVGYFSFLMQARSTGNVLKQSENTLFVIIYGVGTILLETMHWFLADPIYDYLKNAPLPEKEPEEEEKEEEEAEEEEA